MAAGLNSVSDRIEMLRAFDETQAGVKGLVDSGLQKVPEIFVRPSDELAHELTTLENKATLDFQIPVIDLSDIQKPEGRKRIVEKVKVASETWGFFQVVNHGIPTSVVDGMIDGVRKFHEQDVEEKKKYYSRDMKRVVRFGSNFDLYRSKAANWRDTLTFPDPSKVNSDELPDSCRQSALEYSKHVTVVGNRVLELLSEGLGLKPDHLYKMECSKRLRYSCHYYPACPDPQLTMGTTKHSDPGFLTILLQSSQISGLQVLHQGQWVDVEPTPGALVVNIGDLLQLVSNGKFISNKHRAAVNKSEPRISVACFYSGPFESSVSDGGEAKVYGPIEELISEKSPAQYREVILGDYYRKFMNTGLDENLGLDYYKLWSLVTEQTS